MVDGSPTVRRRRLGNRLKQARLALGMTGHQVAEWLEISQSKVSRVESGTVGVRPKELREFLDLYQVPDDEREGLLSLAREGKGRGWWTRYASVISRNHGDYIGFEMEADEIWDWEPTLVPGQLQTEAYARAVIRSWPNADEGTVDQLTEIRMERQRQLAKTQPTLHVIMDESVLHRIVGDSDIMADQIHRLAAAASEPQVTAQIMPFERGMYSLCAPTITILTYSDGLQVVWGESVSGDERLEEEKSDQYVTAFKHLQVNALDPAASLEMLRTAERSFR